MDHLINYAQIVEECFAQVAKFLLPVLGLRILIAIRHPHKRDMSSWIPYWSQNLPLRSDYSKFEPCDDRVGQPVPKLNYLHGRNHKMRPISVEKREKRLELLVRGCKYARTVESSQVFMFRNTEDVKAQIKELFSCLGYIERSAHIENARNDNEMGSKLGKNIFNGECEAVSRSFQRKITPWLALSMEDGYEVYQHLICWSGALRVSYKSSANLETLF